MSMKIYQRRDCLSCTYKTLPLQSDPTRCSGCGNNYPLRKNEAIEEKPDKNIIRTIKSFGMLDKGYRWVQITCEIKVDRETPKAVHGLITVFEKGKYDECVYSPIINWVPKSMCEKPNFICTKYFDEENKVANEVFT